MSCVMGEITFSCVTLKYQQDTIIYCGDKYSLYLQLHSNMTEDEFYYQCYKSEINPIIIDSESYSSIQDDIIYMNDSLRTFLYDNRNNIDEQKNILINELNKGGLFSMSSELLRIVYLCWIHNILIGTDDEVGPYYWFSYTI